MIIQSLKDIESCFIGWKNRIKNKIFGILIQIFVKV